MVGLSVALTAIVALELFNLGVSIVNARKLGHDTQARQWARDAEDQAQYAHTRLRRHLVNDHDKEINGTDLD